MGGGVREMALAYWDLVVVLLLLPTHTQAAELRNPPQHLHSGKSSLPPPSLSILSPKWELKRVSKELYYFSKR
jgi:hypothetical protein